MRNKLLFIATIALGGSLALHAAEKIVGGPKGGRLLETEGQRAEFFVTKDRKVEIAFYDASLKPVTPTVQTVAVTAEPSTGRTKLEMEKTNTGFVSKQALPAGEPYRVVVQLRAEAEAKPQNYRIELNLATCGECKRAEYACTCDAH